MACDAYIGLPGSGKSYGVCANVILPAFDQGRRVVTNIPLDLEQFASRGRDLEKRGLSAGVVECVDVNDWIRNPQIFNTYHGCVVVIDEVWRLWPNGLMPTQIDEAHKAFFAEHRHMVDEQGRSCQIVLSTQCLSQIAQTMRILVENTYVSVKLTELGLDNKYKCLVFAGAVTLERQPKSRQINTLNGTYSENVYKYYRSATKSKTGGVGLESKMDSRGNRLRSPSFVASVVFVVVAIPFGVYMTISAMHDMFTSDKPSSEERTQVSPATPSPPSRAGETPTGSRVASGPKDGVALPPAPPPPRQVLSDDEREQFVSRYRGLASSPVARRAAIKRIPAKDPPLSRQWRISGHVSVGRSIPLVQLEAAAGSTRTIRGDRCEFSPYDDRIKCNVDGELVTQHSGSGAWSPYRVNPDRRWPESAGPMTRVNLSGGQQ